MCRCKSQCHSRRLAHTRFLATTGPAPPVEVRNRVIFADSMAALNGLEIGRRSVAMCIYLQKYGCRTLTIRDFAVSDYGIALELIWEAVKFWGACPKPPKCFCTLRRSSYKRSVPMLHPSIDGVLATPLVSHAVRILYRLSVRTFNLFTLARTCQLHPWLASATKM